MGMVDRHLVAVSKTSGCLRCNSFEDGFVLDIFSLETIKPMYGPDGVVVLVEPRATGPKDK